MDIARLVSSRVMTSHGFGSEHTPITTASPKNPGEAQRQPNRPTILDFAVSTVQFGSKMLRWRYLEPDFSCGAGERSTLGAIPLAKGKPVVVGTFCDIPTGKNKVANGPVLGGPPRAARITDHLIGSHLGCAPLRRVHDSQPAHLIEFLAVALAVHMHASSREALHCLPNGLQWRAVAPGRLRGHLAGPHPLEGTAVEVPARPGKDYAPSHLRGASTGPGSTGAGREPLGQPIMRIDPSIQTYGVRVAETRRREQ